MRILLACVTGFLLDLLIGDPVWMYHPVRMIGALICWMEQVFRKICGDSGRALLAGGIVLCVVVVAVSAAVPAVILFAAGRIHPYLRFALEGFMCYQLLAAKSLKQESMKVYHELQNKDLKKARKAVSMIVGRDTAELTEEGVTKAAVETIAENTSDGVIAPLFYMMILGAPLGFFYKAVNTMDSMIGYKNEKYLYFGRAAAKLDDVMNFIPARVSALLMTGAAFLTGMDGKHAWHTFLRDRNKHASPNAAQTEAVCAGALRIQLAGDAYYFGKLYKKDNIGDELRPIECEDIRRANILLYGTAFLALVLFGGIRIIWRRI